MHLSIDFRPICDDDLNNLKQIYASTRAEELQVLSWSQEEKEIFLQRQFQAQHQYYQAQFREAEYLMILEGNQPIGRLYVDRRPDEIRIIDIAILPAYRGQGIGSSLLQQILAEGQCSHKSVRIHVEQNNRALKLYQRLGFQKKSENGVYFLMEWMPNS
ncbi:GNAT family N-acetyltransferase [Acaryochloris sp. CCMEE 5410]|uniref:GNAT family N-acetyltransferase n=1 Tax=Acaryochloris sp. CCMEE 5410 TaxID=310037 RepID=UPI0002484569|nr:GNAT family N-acetyltransferase [Acaryochloris sp. CCMEE 5410]KAI9135295.1 GNAT family N-acetyltransferase [Acaryochloris sp. CCMEE 5410]